ncbi:MAG: hypothetical protein ABJC09_00300 [Terriglobia bacterium]
MKSRTSEMQIGVGFEHKDAKGFDGRLWRRLQAALELSRRLVDPAPTGSYGVGICAAQTTSHTMNRLQGDELRPCARPAFINANPKKSTGKRRILSFPADLNHLFMWVQPIYCLG